jgi:hypothetical protein
MVLAGIDSTQTHDEFPEIDLQTAWVPPISTLDMRIPTHPAISEIPPRCQEFPANGHDTTRFTIPILEFLYVCHLQGKRNSRPGTGKGCLEVYKSDRGWGLINTVQNLINTVRNSKWTPILKFTFR